MHGARRESQTELVRESALERELKEAQKHTPRFLFRSFAEDSGGGYVGLNTMSAIIPHAFLDETAQIYRDVGYNVRPRKRLTDFTIPDLTDAVNEHMEGQINFAPTQFSSWAFDIVSALRYLSEGGYLVVIDTKRLDRKPEIYHTPALSAAIARCPEAEHTVYKCDHEYLAHGPIKGHGFHVLDLSQAAAEGWDEFLDSALQHKEHRWGDVAEAKRLAQGFGLKHDKRQELLLFVVIAILIARQEPTDDDLEPIYQELQHEGISIPGTFMHEDWIMTDIACLDCSEPGKRSIEILRALVYRQFGAKEVAGMRGASPV